MFQKINIDLSSYPVEKMWYYSECFGLHENYENL